MSLYVFSKESENDLKEIYCYGFLNHGERQADVYKDALKDKCQFLLTVLIFAVNGMNLRHPFAFIITKSTSLFTS